MVLGVTRRLAVELSEPANIIEGHRRLSNLLVVRIDGLCSRQIKHGPQQHRRMAV